MSDLSPQAAETTPLGTPAAPVDEAMGSASAVTPESFDTFAARENAAATGVEWKEPGKVTPTEGDKTTTYAATTTAATTPPSPTSKRTERRAQRDQEQINETIRRAVQEATEATERRLRAELGKPAESTKPETAAKSAEFQPTRPKPTDAEFETYPDFVEALAEWTADQRDAKREFEAAKTKAADDERSQLRELNERASTWVQRRDAFAATTPEFEDKALPFLDHVTAGTPLGDVLIESEVGPQMALYLATHPDEAERIARLAPVSALRALGKLEAKFDSDSTTSASATTAGPAAKTVTSAPAPPTTLASRSATPADPTAAALAAGDFEAFEAAENRKALTAGR